MEKAFNWQARVYYEDTDAGGVVYHGRYLAFLERARTEMLRYYQIEQSVLLEQNIAFVVKSMNIDYIFPARLDDLLTVTNKVISVRQASMVFEQHIYNQNQQRICQAEVLIACVDVAKMKPRSLPQSIVSEFI